MLTRNKKLKDYGIPAEDIEKLNTMLKGFPVEYGYLLSSAALSACPKNTVIADMVIENILHRKSYRKISKERYIPMNPKDFYGYRRKTVAVLYERMRLLGVWEDEKMRLIDADKIIDSLGNSDMDFAIGTVKQRVDGLWIMSPAWQNHEFWELKPNSNGETTVEVLVNAFDNPELLQEKLE